MIKLKKLLNEKLHKKIPSILYHATFKYNIESIKKSGLLPQGGKISYINFDNTEYGVYLDETSEGAISFVEASENEDIPEEWFKNIIVITIDTSKLDINKFDVDSNIIPPDEGDDTRPFVYKDIIPPIAFIAIN